jgi:ElaB/YqjD/DUF883 family membrane-anchored ribosome-binding protein
MENDRNRQAGGLGGSTGAQGSTGSTGSSTPGMGAGSTGMGAGSSGFGRDTGMGGTGDAGTRAGSYDRKFTEGSSEELKHQVEDKIEEGRERVQDALETGRDRAADAFDSGRTRVAGQLENFGDRLEERARTMEDAGGVQGRAGHAARRASEALDNSADYIRSHDAQEMRGDFERAIRERPLFSVGMAVGAGFLLARILRD